MATQTLSKSKAAEAVQRQLARYRAMRNFAVTAEPRGDGAKAARATGELPFVVQKHLASRLHYDFRLGWRGVLKSWAVTKGPSYFPGDRRLAVQVEDHPMEYGGFEGTIPRGQYGGGTVMVWDFGEWKPLRDVDRGLADGHLKFELNGKKLHGRWALVRMHSHDGRVDKPNWLLIKDRDEFAQDAGDPAITNDSPLSAITGRTIEQIAESADAVWDSKEELLEMGGNGAHRTTGAKNTARKAGATNRGKANAISARRPGQNNGAISEVQPGRLLRSARRERFPGFLSPQLAQPTDAAPNGADWVHELKLDGYRIQIQVRAQGRGGADRRGVKLLTRKGLDWTARMPDIARAAAELPCESAILDGEVVALDERGIANFADLQTAFHEGRQHYLTYFAFDLLHLNGHNLRELPLVERKKILARLLAQAGENSPLRFSEHFEADGHKVFAKACALGAEGIVSKLAQGKYALRRSCAWLKVKCTGQQEFVIGGFTPPFNGGHGIGALLLGYYQRGKLIYAGRSGTGFTQRTQRSLRTQLDGLIRKRPAFAEIPRAARRDAQWVYPKLVAEIAFSTWTRDNLVRQASFKGLREDKPANEVTREMAGSPLAHSRNDSAARGAERHANKNGAATLAITHPEKILDPETGLTKQTLAEYYLAVAVRMLPHVADRPLSVVRCPDGSMKPCFFQKHVGQGLPEGVNVVAVENRKSGEKEEYLTLNSAQGLVGMAQMGVLEIHPWGSRNESLDKPDRIVFDLDPDAAIDWQTLTASAKILRARLKKLHLESFVKSTGGKGLHVVVAIEPEHEWPLVKQFAHRVVLAMEAEQPDLYITKMSKAARKNRIYLDYLRNDRGSTSVAPFSPRARSGVPVAITLGWKDLQLDALPRFHVADFTEWQSRLRRDPWQAVTKQSQRLSAETLRAAGVNQSPDSH